MYQPSAAFNRKIAIPEPKVTDKDTVNQELLRLIKLTPFFYELSQPEFNEIVKEVVVHNLASGKTVISEKERGNSIFFVTDGVLRASIKDVTTKRSITLSKLVKGSFFGEFSLLTGRLRSASVITVTQTELVEIPRTIYEKVALKYSFPRRFLIDLCLQHEKGTAEMLDRLHINRRKHSRMRFKGKVMFQKHNPDVKNNIIKIRRGVLGDISEGGLSFYVAKDELSGGFAEMFEKKFNVKVFFDKDSLTIKVLCHAINAELCIKGGELTDYHIVRMKFMMVNRKDKKTLQELFAQKKLFLIRPLIVWGYFVTE